jgi:hypothetical protein
MRVHHASIFSYKEYQEEIRWLVEQVDQQNYEPLRDRTCKAIQRIRQEWPLSNLGWTVYEEGVEKEVVTQEWPLLEHGESGLTIEDEIRNQDILMPRDIGYWFLIVLAEYLQPCQSPLSNWGVLYSTLTILGWEQIDCDLLFKGLPTSKLVKPEIEEKSPWPLKETDPYWLWLHPSQARSGWLPTQSVHNLYNQLREMEDKIKTFDIRQIPNIDASNPVVIKEYDKYLQSAYHDSLAMLSMAQQSNQGLFMSITIYA